MNLSVSAAWPLALVCSLIPVTRVAANQIQGLFPTGADGAGNVLAIGEPDPHYDLLSLPSDRVIQPCTTCGSGNYATPPSGSAWIAPADVNTDSPVGEYRYQLTFDLAGLDPSTARITGQATADNGVSLLLNGVNLGEVTHTIGTLSPFTIQAGFNSGLNTLTFVVTNAGPHAPPNPTALLVGAISGTANPAPASCGDDDGDGEVNETDACPGTVPAARVDASGCSVVQFCGGFDAGTNSGARTCRKADWENDEPLMRGRDADCTVSKGAKGRSDDRCVRKEL